VLSIVKLISEDRNNKMFIVVKGRVGVFTLSGRLIDTLEVGRMYNDTLIYDTIKIEFIALASTSCLFLQRSEFNKFLSVNCEGDVRRQRRGIIKRKRTF